MRFHIGKLLGLILRRLLHDFDAHQLPGYALAQIGDHRFEQLEGFRLVFVERIALRIAAQAHDLAQVLQQAWTPLGVEVTITAVDFPVFNERLAGGAFDSYIGAWLDEPSPRGLADQWTRGGWGKLNYGRYDDAAFDRLFARAILAGDTVSAGPLYRAAMDTLNADAPALFLYAPMQTAGASRRISGVSIDPYSWLSGVSGWQAGPRK